MPGEDLVPKAKSAANIQHALNGLTEIPQVSAHEIAELGELFDVAHTDVAVEASVVVLVEFVAFRHAPSVSPCEKW